MNIKSEFMFDGDFQCTQCGSIIGLKARLAIVKSVGVEVQCRHCQTLYFVTEEGAVRVESRTEEPTL